MYVLVSQHELDIARFGARAPRAGAFDVKRLIYCSIEIVDGMSFFMLIFHTYTHTRIYILIA